MGFTETKFGLQYYLSSSKLGTLYQLASKSRLSGISYYGVRGISIYILVRKTFKDYKIVDNTIYTRFNHQYFTKGSVGIKMLIYDMEYLFICVNLPDKYTYDHMGIYERKDSLDVLYNTLVNNHKNVFILGGFNFRLHYVPEHLFDDINLSNSDDIKTLLKYDEFNILVGEYLNNVKEMGSLDNLNSFVVKFAGYFDNPAFPPNSKIKIGKSISIKSKYAKIADIYDSQNIYWADRIITNTSLKCKLYNLDDDLLVSYTDHFPVFGLWVLEL